ncbi:hypothetical protein [Herbiconiux sp. VKM Ac-2851]|uniref:hypothetical protein n=1 Tax=Herbiconiux sp. VKM Ac-2851 TaxID=2739025 RepID=UPI0015649F78|nr:hypothetical protein [Herbiconiux sp. VKM Ac-2851]NQX35255.1 hypothetical protein [Herbiconiux sp. VKM Ac-2851]
MNARTNRFGTGLLLALALSATVSGCSGERDPSAGAEAPTPPAASAPSTGGEATPTPAGTDAASMEPPFVQPYVGDYDPAEYGSGDVEDDMAMIGPELVAGVEAIRGYAPGRYPDVYTGLASGTRGDPNVLRIYLTELDPAIEDDLVSVSGMKRDQVLFEQSYVSARDAQAASDAVTADVDAGDLEGIDLVGWGSGLDGLLELSLEGHDQAQIDTLLDRYGPAVRILTDAPTATATDGSADTGATR